MPAKRSKKAVKRPIRQAKQARSLATVETIVEATIRILATKGCSGVTTNAVAERAGVSVGSIYEYFRDKQAILDVIIDRHLSRGEELLLESTTEDPAHFPVDKIVKKLVSGFVGLHRDNPRLHKVLSTEVTLSKAQQSRVDALRSMAIELVAKALTDQVNAAELKATLIVDVADSLTHRWLIDEVGISAPADVITVELEKMLKLYVVS